MLKLYRARRHPSRDRRPAGLGRARLLPRPEDPLHHRLPHALSRIRARPHPPAGLLELCLRAPLPRAVIGRAGGRPVDPRRARPARLQESRAMVARRRHRGLPSAPARRRQRAPPDLALCRPRGDREEHQGLSRSRPPRHQMGGGRRSAAQGAEAPLSRRALLRLGRHRGAVAPLRRGRLLRLPQPHRHVRAGDGRGAGLGRSGRGLPRARPARCRDGAGRRRHRRGLARRLPRRGEGRSGRLSTPRRDLHLGQLRGAVPRHPAAHPARRLAAA